MSTPVVSTPVVSTPVVTTPVVTTPVVTTRARIALVSVALLGACLLTGCQPEDEKDGPTIAADPAARLAAVCTEVLNARDAEVFVAGRDAAVEFLGAVLQPHRADPADVDEYGEQMTAVRDLLVADRAALADHPDVQGVDGWDAVLAPLDDTIGMLDTRIALADASSADWPPAKDDLMPGTGFSVADPDGPLADLGLVGRDCEVMANAPGPLPDAADFSASAALACSTIVDRRRSAGYDDAVDLNVDAVLAVLQDKTVEVTTELTDALETLVEEWTQTRSDLEEVPRDDLGDADRSAAWDDALRLADDRVDGYRMRADALASGDDATIANAFAPDTLGAPGWDWQTLGLALRDCRTIAS